MLTGLLRRLGPEAVVRDLGVTPAELSQMVRGLVDVPLEVLERVDRVYDVLASGARTVGVDPDQSVRLESTEPVPPVDVPAELRPPPYEPRGSALNGSDVALGALDHLKADLFRVRMMAVRQQVGIGLREDEKLASKLFVLQIELTLIVEFSESVPVPGLGWTALELEEEAEKRFRRRDRLQAALAKYNTGFRGMVRRLAGRRPQTVDEIMQSMIHDSELIHKAGALERESSEAALARLLGPSGLDVEGVRELLRQHTAAAA